MNESRKRELLLGKVSKRKRSRRDEDFDEEDVIDFADMEPVSAGEESDESHGSEEETAEQKRLRLAKAYIDELKAAAGSGDELDEDNVAEQLQTDALEAAGKAHRRLADMVDVPDLHAAESPAYGDGRFLRGHRLSATAVALADDDSAAFTVTKCGRVLRWDMERFVRTPLHRPGDSKAPERTGPDWVPSPARKGSANALYCVAVSSDARYLAAGGGDARVHVFDLRTNQHVRAFSGHRDVVAGVAFRRGSHQLFSCSFDRSVKLWSVADGAYMDTLFGHQSEVTSIDVLRQERCITGAFDRTCRVWKIPEESQLVFRPTSLATDSVRYVTGTEWISGSIDGSVAIWSQTKKKPMHVVRGAHKAVRAGQASAGTAQPGPCSVPEDVTSWVQSVAVCPGSDLAASGAGDGVIRLWAVKQVASHKQIEAVGALPARGFANGLAIARSGRFLVAAMGQEPRLGRWLRDGHARNGLLVHGLRARD